MKQKQTFKRVKMRRDDEGNLFPEKHLELALEHFDSDKILRHISEETGIG